MIKVKFKHILGIASISFVLGGCGFDLSTDQQTIELPNTFGINVEGVFSTPQFILNHTVNFDEIAIDYRVTKNDAYVANIKLYVSDDQVADNLQNGDDEDIINVMLGVNENEKSGSTTSALLKDILNAKQPKFVIGAQNLSANPLSTIYIEVTVRFKGTYSL